VGYTKVIHSGSLLEIYSYERDLEKERRPNVRKNGYNRTNRFSTTRRADSVGRLKKCFLRLVRANLSGLGRPTLLTLTFVELVGIEMAYPCLTTFVTRLRKLCPQFRYVGVPEFQKRGSTHFHLLAWGIQDEIVEKEATLRHIQRLWGRGFLDISHTDGSPKLAGYLAKYLLKAVYDERLLDKKAYSCSRGMLRPMQTTIRTVLDYLPLIYDVDDSTPCTISSFNTYWLGRCDYKRYELKE